LRQASEM